MTIKSLYHSLLASIDGYVRELLVLVALLFLVGILWPETFWLFDVAGHFVVHYTLFALFVLLWCLRSKRLLWAGSALIIMLAGLWQMQVTTYQTHMPSCVLEQPMTAVISNLLYTNNDLDGITQVLTQHNADVLGVVEMTTDMRDHLQRVLEKEGYEHAAYPKSWAAGAGLWSRYPIQDQNVRWIGDHNIPYLRVSVTHPEYEKMVIYVLHAWSPGPGGRTAERNAFLRLIAEEIKQTPKGTPVLVMGDLNTTRFMPVFSDLIKRAGLNDPAPFVPIGTWPDIVYRLGVQIDHILTKCLPEPDLTAFTMPGSDHRALKAVFVSD